VCVTVGLTAWEAFGEAGSPCDPTSPVISVTGADHTLAEVALPGPEGLAGDGVEGADLDAAVEGAMIIRPMSAR